MRMKNFPSAEVVAELCFNKFKTLPKTGKPTSSEWTVLSGIVQFDNDTNECKVVALGTGTKCIGQAMLCPFGIILNDSHAEVMARRSFLRYMYVQLLTDTDAGTVFAYDAKKICFRLKDSVSFHFFSTQAPCGDACIVFPIKDEIPKKRAKTDDAKIVVIKKDDSDFGDVLGETSKLYTGAKLIGCNHPDPMYQRIGAIRTKPGRGDRTLSLSCSDKLSRWNIMGIQGALLDSVLESPVYLKTFNFCCEHKNLSMERSIFKRWEADMFTNSRFHLETPEIRVTKGNNFNFRCDAKKSPSPNGLAWCAIQEKYKPYEVSVNGKRQGITSKKLYSKHAALKISKRLLMEKYCELLRSRPQLLKKFGLDTAELETKTYSDFKMLALEYQDAWKLVKESIFRQWTQKPKNLLEFTIISALM